VQLKNTSASSKYNVRIEVPRKRKIVKTHKVKRTMARRESSTRWHCSFNKHCISSSIWKSHI